MHDHAYKSIFSHPRVVMDLLRGFVHEDWVTRLDFSTLEKQNGHYVSDDLRDREDDLVWRVRLRGGDGEWLYVYLLLEFQRTIDPHMAVRLLTYLGLLYQDLLKSGQIKKRLPPIFPLVLYNGEAPWSAALAVEDLIEAMPASLAPYQPRFRYFLLDEGRLAENQLNQPDNSVAGLIQIERSDDLEQISLALARLTQKLAGPEYLSLRQTFSAWIRHLVSRRYLPGEKLPEVPDLPEMKQMIEERMERWRQNLRQEALAQGMAEGIAQGGQESARRTLKRQLARRFGPLSEETVGRIDTATLEQLEIWLDAVLDAASVEEVLKQA